MKRFIAFALAAVLCLSLASCGKKEENKYAKYEDIFELLEEEKYDKAIEKIEHLKKSDDKEVKCEEFVGVWKYYDYNGNHAGTVNFPVDPSFETKTLTIEKDGTFTFDGENEISGEWTSSEDGKSITMDIGAGHQTFEIAKENGFTFLRMVAKPSYRFFLTTEGTEIEEKYQFVSERILFSTIDYDIKLFYNLVKELGDYKDSETYLSYFTEYKDGCVSVKEVRYDSFGQKLESNYDSYYTFEEDDGSDPYDLLNFLGEEYSYEREIVMNDDGTVNSVTWVHGNEAYVFCKATFEYDRNGSAVKAHFQHSDGTEWTNYYEIDSVGRIVWAYIVYIFYTDRADKYDHGYEYYIQQFEFDDDGKITGEYFYTPNEPGEDTEIYVEYTEYIYDENEVLVSVITYYGKGIFIVDEHGKRYFSLYRDFSIIFDKAYSYNERGLIEKIYVTDYSYSGEIEDEYALEYTYEDVIKFNKD